MAKFKKEYTKEKDKQKETWDGKEKEGKKIVDDKKLAADTMGKLKLEGTQDLINKMKQEASKLEKDINAKMEKHKSEHDSEAKKAEGVEKELKDSAHASSTDSSKIKDASGKAIDSKVKQELNSAAIEAKEDSDFLSRIKKDRGDERKKSQEETKKQFNDVINKKIQINK